MFRFLSQILSNPFDQLLKKAQREQKKKILIFWNRGLGDIALGMYALVWRIKQYLPGASLSFMLRKELEEGFFLLEGIDEIIAVPNWSRGEKRETRALLQSVGIQEGQFDWIIDNPNPTKWLKWQIGRLVPKLLWRAEWDSLAQKFSLLGSDYIGVHIHSETTYAYEKNWPLAHWKELFSLLVTEHKKKILLFGNTPTPIGLNEENIVDLRGKTTLLEMLAIIKNHCTHLIAPDSGVLSFAYYLDVNFPLHIVSLWADPRQGILKQRVLSPNKQLIHHPLIGRKEKVENVAVDAVLRALDVKR